MATLGERIKQLRDEQGLTQDKLCADAKLSKGFLSDIENNKRSVGSAYLLQIANALGTSVDYLLTGKQDERKTASGPVVIPPELSVYAKQAQLSYSETIELLAAARSVIAQRSNEAAKTLSPEGWQQLHETLRGLFG